MAAILPHTLTEALAVAPAERTFLRMWSDQEQCETVTFGEFRRLALGQAALLLAGGVKAGDRVVIVMPQSAASMAAFMGAMLLGAVPAFLAYPNFKIEPAKYRFGLNGVTRNLQARAVLIDNEFPEEFLEHISLDGDAALLRCGGAASLSAEPEIPETLIEPDSLAFLQHSAGTTGLQKGVALTHAAVLRQLQTLSAALNIDGGADRIYSWLPLYHDMGLIACFMLPLVCHMTVVMQSPLEWVMYPETMLEIITRDRCTLAWMPNFAFQFMARRTPTERRSQYDLSSVRALINCSEPVRAASMDEFHSAFAPIGMRREALQSSYAMAENVFAVTQSGANGSEQPGRVSLDGPILRAEHRVVEVDDKQPGATVFVSSGQLLPGNEVRIIADSGDTLEDGNVGEILIKSDCLFNGYYNRPDLTEVAFCDGWYRSGDLGFLLRDELFVVGRKKDLLIVAGENIYAQDLEEIAFRHPAIHDGRAVAIGIYNPDLGTQEVVLVAEVERADLLSGAEAIENEIRSQIAAAIGISVRSIFLKPPQWIVKSTAGKPARSTTRDKLIQEHPQLSRGGSEL